MAARALSPSGARRSLSPSSSRNSVGASLVARRPSSHSPAPAAGARHWCTGQFSKWLLTVPTGLLRVDQPEQGGVQAWSVVALTGPRAPVPTLDVVRSEDEFIDAILEHCQRCVDDTCKYTAGPSEPKTSEAGEAVIVAIPALTVAFGPRWQELKAAAKSLAMAPSAAAASLVSGAGAAVIEVAEHFPGARQRMHIDDLFAVDPNQLARCCIVC